MKTSSRFLRRSLWLAGTTLLLCAQAQAAEPLHRCSIQGRLVIQPTPCAGAPAAAAVATAPTLIAADAAETAPKKRTLAEIMREREAENRERPKAREPQIDGARILRDRMGAL